MRLLDVVCEFNAFNKRMLKESYPCGYVDETSRGRIRRVKVCEQNLVCGDGECVSTKTIML